ncbi:uncharacterized protein E0L32_004050 [Thyridium curvatum]|uniref:Rrp15p-domain-containing protein n=1 Tax=Thyridium curvatum TaxID=1093900 RepID=A0A507BHD0_9PEZI|nr:uncharacterized protein E0L32_004050 [Thyridium curvatum]TPX16401.1 hypothetical protein E0L32_004050 [Thyridium curvatum]
MGGQPAKKRSADSQARLKALRPAKKQRKQREYHSSDSEDDAPQDGGDFKAVNLLDSDNEDLDNVEVDDVPSGSGSGSDSDSSSAPASSRKAPKAALKKSKKQQPNQKSHDAPESSSDNEDEEDGDDDEDEDDELDADGNKATGANRQSSRSKRNDPAAFATSLSKILSTKLSTARRADPVLARSAAAQQSARDAVDQALENKARRRLREQKRLAMEKGRVRDVLVASTATGLGGGGGGGEADGLAAGRSGGETETTAQIMATEKRLRKVAQRGVVKLFNAVRAAQVKAAEAERTARAQGVIGMGRREEKVAEMSKKGFLDLIASGGGGLKKGPLEEA